MVLLNYLVENCLVYDKDGFELRSGGVSNFYFDKFILLSDPVWSDQVCYLMWGALGREYDVVAGMELGGALFAKAMSRANISQMCPCCFVRRESKKYGTGRIIEGYDKLKGKNVLLVEDVITEGTSVNEAIRNIKTYEPKSITLICLINNSGHANLHVTFDGVGIKFMYMYRMETLIKHYNENGRC